MSMAALLDAVRNALKTALTLDSDHCRVVPGGEPPPVSGLAFVGIDEGDAPSTSFEAEYLAEEYNVEVSIWRRTGTFTKDRAEGIYLGNIRNLDDLERAVIRAIHASWAIPTAVNTALGLPEDSAGDILQTPLYYVGRGKTTAEASEGSKGVTTWMTRTLRFRGARRIQKLAAMH